ncbi:MAG: sigma-70 family RNA polymerase sigma factor [Syntrophomonadaceae bacterium]|nr:sigma-70 family RNA polymerase sigma factor [Syntrophomonadaceae bacterium]
MATTADEFLAQQALDGDLDAFEELVLRHQRMVFAVAYRMTGQREEAEDVAQEVFVNLYRKLARFDSSRRFLPWLQRVTVNTCISHLRRRKKVVALSFDDSLAHHSHEQPASALLDPARALEAKELRGDIQHALLRLPESYRAVLILRYQLELSNQEIADLLGVSRENIEVRIHRARKALRKHLLARLEERGESVGLSAR